MDKEPVSLAQIFADVMRSARVIGEDKEIHFVVDIPEEQPFMIEGDYGRLRQMFLIVLDNAVKFSERGQGALDSCQPGRSDQGTDR